MSSLLHRWICGFILLEGAALYEEQSGHVWNVYVASKCDVQRGENGWRSCLTGKQNNPSDSSSAVISTASLVSLCSIRLFYTFRMISLPFF